jgi:peroxisome proliferator-activated receptor gamma coactivator-related protein 1
VDAYEAVEHGNDDPHLPKYDLSFGGRRAFCKETYADLGRPQNSKIILGFSFISRM